MKQTLITLAVILASALYCAESKPLVLVSIPPQIEAVSSIGCHMVDVTTIVPTGASPETYTPSARQLTQFSKARLFLTIGAPIEKAIVPKIAAAFPSIKIVDGTKGMTLRHMEEQHEGHGHELHDPHVWLSIPNMIAYAKNVADALGGIIPQHKEQFQKSARLYTGKLTELDTTLKAALSQYKGESILVFHPAFGYFLDNAGIHQVSVEKHGKEASGKHIALLRQKVNSIKPKVLFVQPQFNRKNAESIANILDLKITVLDPLPADYSDGMSKLAGTILNAFKQAE